MKLKENRILENSSLEYKEIDTLESCDPQLGKAMSGLANSDGGIIILGVKEVKELKNGPGRIDNFNRPRIRKKLSSRYYPVFASHGPTI